MRACGYSGEGAYYLLSTPRRGQAPQAAASSHRHTAACPRAARRAADARHADWQHALPRDGAAVDPRGGGVRGHGGTLSRAAPRTVSKIFPNRAERFTLILVVAPAYLIVN